MWSIICEFCTVLLWHSVISRIQTAHSFYTWTSEMRRTRASHSFYAWNSVISRTHAVHSVCLMYFVIKRITTSLSFFDWNSVISRIRACTFDWNFLLSRIHASLSFYDSFLLWGFFSFSIRLTIESYLFNSRISTRLLDIIRLRFDRANLALVPRKRH